MKFYNTAAGACQFLGDPLSFVTTATGVGKATGEMQVSEKGYEFFVDGTTDSLPLITDDSFTVTLPRS